MQNGRGGLWYCIVSQPVIVPDKSASGDNDLPYEVVDTAKISKCVRAGVKFKAGPRGGTLSDRMVAPMFVTHMCVI
jgi:hypothetical protein